MLRSLWTSATGMNAMQFKVDTISNNLSNVNTTGFKKSRADFEDLLYQTMKMAGTPATEDTVVPTGIQVGLGVKTAATQKIFEQGSFQATANKLDFALEGEGFFKVLMPDGTEAYTRDGSFKIDSNGQVVNSNGYKLIPEIIFPEGFEFTKINVTTEGLVEVAVAGDNEMIEVETLTISRFINPAGLASIGGNLYIETVASGPEILGQAGLEGQAKIHQGFIEMSNVQVVDEMVDMIVAQRAYELNSKSIQTSDNLLGTVTTLKR